MESYFAGCFENSEQFHHQTTQLATLCHDYVVGLRQHRVAWVGVLHAGHSERLSLLRVIMKTIAPSLAEIVFSALWFIMLSQEEGVLF